MRKHVIGKVQALLVVRDITAVCGLMRVEEFLETDDIGVLAGDEVEHFFAVTGSAFFLCDPFVEAADVPGQYADGIGRFCRGETVEGVKGQEAVDIGPADQQSQERDQGPAAPSGQEDACQDKTDEEKEKERDRSARRGPPGHARFARA